jgi:nucleoside-diphosphate-sugar epimerase
MMKKALITGATGFIGVNLTRRLLSEGWRVHIITRQDSSIAILGKVCEQVIVFIHDGSTEKMLSIMEEVRPDVVFHLASIFLVTHQIKDITPLITSNLLLGTQLVDAMSKNDVRYIVNAGSSWQHFNNDYYTPVNLYAATKNAFEMILRFYTSSTNIKAITLTLFDTYGANDPRAKLFSLLQKTSKSSKPLSMSKGEQLIDIVYIDDVVDAFVMAADRFLKGIANSFEDFSVSSGHPIKLKDLVDTYCQINGETLPIIWGGRPYREREVMVPWNKGQFLPGWHAKVNFENGVKLIQKIEDVGL